MTVSVPLMCFSTTIISSLIGIVLFFFANVNATSECEKYDFPCEDGGCVDSGLWCDSHKDCSDGSDEKYCKLSTLFKSDPNKCPSTYFKCQDGPCIPMIGRCDGYDNCNDKSDEKNCEEQTHNHVTASIGASWVGNHHSSPSTPIPYPISEIRGANEDLTFTYRNSSQNTQPSSGLMLHSFSVQKNKARSWLFSQRRSDFGWGGETPRAIIALYLSENQPTSKNSESDMLMIKQLEIQLSLDIARNGTKPMKLADLALFINALIASCKNPRNFYGDNLISLFRDMVNTAQGEEAYINPSIYLILCISNTSTYDDARNLQDMLLGDNATINMIEMQAMAFLATSCIIKRTDFLNSTIYDSIKLKFLSNLKVHGFPGNAYEASLIFQALQEMNMTLNGLTSFILSQQQEDGSFDDILSTYFVLPILAGRNMLQIGDNCPDRNTSNLIPLEVLKHVKSKKMPLMYSLNFGDPVELTQTIQMHVPEDTNFLNVMRLAQEINLKYRFKLSENRDVPVVYSIGGMTNDVEKGIYWRLYKAAGNSSENGGKTDWVPYQGDIRELILVEGDRVLFWYRPL